ncbi:hypothetical protein K7X08_027690 [Anisodus acutangulus]|uniref:DUF1985 domain-containing protein n=1 Tax=Anisodus acutangulus TaxID=402998 RepID=A0A9Q1LMN5_9SOLA|nr:hypothetical protein K7X08_027690 [Anisodus acutangulus]
MLRYFMVRELNASNEDAFLMDINGSELRFTIREFVIVSGLKCTGDLDDFKAAKKIAEAFDDKIIRTRYGVLLWDYAKRKIEAETIKDNEAPLKIKDRF